MIEAQFPWVKLIRSSENLGFAKGNNVAIRQCQGRYIALVNPDVIVLSGLPGCAGGFPGSESQGGQCRPARPQSRHDTAELVPAVPDAVEQLLFGNSAWRTDSRAPGFSPASTCFTFPHDRTMAVDVIVGCFSMIRREAFDGRGPAG